MRPAAPSPSTSPSTTRDDRLAAAVRARRAVFAVFAVAGLGFASLASRQPALRDALGLDLGQLGLLLLAIAVGSVVGLPLAGALTARTGTARAVLLGSSSTMTGLVVAGLGASALHSVPVTAVGLLALGLGNGVWDVAMNLEGAGVEQRLGRAVMPSLHAGFSLGTVVAAGLGVLAAALGVPLWAHLAVVAALGIAAVTACVRAFLPDALAAHPGPAPAAVADAAAAPAHEGAPVDPAAAAAAPATPPRAGALAAWREPRTLLIGVLVLSAAFTEGTANDWMAIAVRDGYGASDAVGAAGFAVFLAAMTAARLVGQRALDRWGRVPVLRATMLLGGAGALLVVFGGSLWVALVGAAVWGAGASLGFPVGISAAADDPLRAAVRVSVVTTIGYTAFLAGPPLLGLLADDVGVLHALLVVAAVALPSLLVSRIAQPLEPAPGAAAAPSLAR